MCDLGQGTKNKKGEIIKEGLNLAHNWPTINRWIEQEGFPPGRMIGRNRVWLEDEVKDWIKSRSSAKTPLRGRAKELVREVA
jgi:hypothetical protein